VPAVPRVGLVWLHRFLMESNGRSFPRTARLTTSDQYQRVFAESTRVSNKAITLLACANEEGFPRLGLAISKKCARRAVQRNRIKRLVRESFRMRQKELPAIDIVVLCRPVSVLLSNQELAEGIEQLWHRLKKQCEKS
jgi:ribonuclease P protein component